MRTTSSIQIEFERLQLAIEPLPFGIAVENLAQISSAYGEWIAARVLHEVYKRCEPHLPRELLSIESWGVLFHGGNHLQSSKIEQVLASIAERPVAIGELRIVLALSWRDSVSQTHTASDLPPVFLSHDRYRADMIAAAAVYDAILDNRFELFEQPVSDATCFASGLYSECLARLFDSTGECLVLGKFLPALERLGLTRAFDRFVVKKTIRQLRARPTATLGCNISALSAVSDGWWTSLIAELNEEPALASRLVIEITESALPEDWANVSAFIGEMQKCGCRIALDDFGTGFISIDFAQSVRADIIKIDGKFARQEHLLQHLIKLASKLAKTVVLEGVEDISLLEIAKKSGARWVQGYFIGRPSKWA